MRIVFIGFFAAFSVIALRSLTIHLFPPNSQSLSQIADSQYTAHIKLSPYRGSIFDRRGDVLALSVRKPSLYVNPREFSPTQSQAQEIAHVLSIPATQVASLTKKKSYFAWLKRKADPSASSRLMAMGIPGLEQISEPARFYPVTPAAANLLGYVNMDDVGVMGLEKQFEKELSGPRSRLELNRDARGRMIFTQSDTAVPESGGMDVYLTIDRAIQEIAEDALETGVKNAKAKSGFAIVADPHTGQILATANVPSFNQNSPNIDVESTWNKALMDVFEPGSVMKAFVIAAAIEDGLIRPTDSFDCEWGAYDRDGVRFRDSHRPSKQMLTVTETFVTSSNVCTYKIAQKLGPRALSDAFRLFGFGQRESNMAFPAQTFGSLSDWRGWRPIRFANLAFGQGMTTTALEVVQAYSALANGGQLMQPYLVQRVSAPGGQIVFANSTKPLRRVLKPETTVVLRSMMRDVVELGATKARVPGYTAGGKTGTSQKVDPLTKRYSHTLHRAVFAGVSPISDPHITVFVLIDEPGIAPHYGALWAAPVFSEISRRTLQYLNVAPDLPSAGAATSRRDSEKLQSAFE